MTSARERAVIACRSMGAATMGRWTTDAEPQSSVRAAGDPVIINVPAQSSSGWRTVLWLAAIGAGVYWGVPMIRSYFRYGTLFPPPGPMPGANPYDTTVASGASGGIHVHVHMPSPEHQLPAQTSAAAGS